MMIEDTRIDSIGCVTEATRDRYGVTWPTGNVTDSGVRRRDSKRRELHHGNGPVVSLRLECFIGQS